MGLVVDFDGPFSYIPMVLLMEIEFAEDNETTRCEPVDQFQGSFWSADGRGFQVDEVGENDQDDLVEVLSLFSGESVYKCLPRLLFEWVLGRCQYFFSLLAKGHHRDVV